MGAGIGVASETRGHGCPSVKIRRTWHAMAGLADGQVCFGIGSVQNGGIVRQIMGRNRTAGMTSAGGPITVGEIGREAAGGVCSRLGAIDHHLMAQGAVGLNGVLGDAAVGGCVSRCNVIGPLPACRVGPGIAVATDRRTVGVGGIIHQRIG